MHYYINKKIIFAFLIHKYKSVKIKIVFLFWPHVNWSRSVYATSSPPPLLLLSSLSSIPSPWPSFPILIIESSSYLVFMPILLSSCAICILDFSPYGTLAISNGSSSSPFMPLFFNSWATPLSISSLRLILLLSRYSFFLLKPYSYFAKAQCMTL